jgi:hypothetical protein
VLQGLVAARELDWVAGVALAFDDLVEPGLTVVLLTSDSGWDGLLTLPQQ